MQLIFIDRRMSQARTIHLTPRLMAGTAIGVLFALFATVLVLYALTIRLGVRTHVPVLHDMMASMIHEEVEHREQYVRDNLGAMARKLGEMQAQIMRLDAVGERVAKIAGIRPEEFNFRETPGRGGPAPTLARSPSFDELQSELARTARLVSTRSDYMDVVESELLEARVRRALLPQNTPVPEGFVGSGFGMRLDPFTGQMSMHSGTDFAAPMGTPIFAAAGGVVTSAEVHPAYGNMVEVDHGHGLSTLYGHASRILVKPGDIVRRGQKIAEVGTTGRSTGPHLHFEVHVNGVPQNPSRFLAAQRSDSPLAGLAPEPGAGAGVGANAGANAGATAPTQPAVPAKTAPAAVHASAAPAPARTSASSTAAAVSGSGAASTPAAASAAPRADAPAHAAEGAAVPAAPASADAAPAS